MRDDRSRKVAAAIVKSALNLDKHRDYPPADVLLIEELSSLVDFQRGKVVKVLTDTCNDLVLKP